MKIVNRKTFLAMPAGTVYSKYAPCYMEEMSIKGDTTPNGGDWYDQDIAGALDDGGDEFSEACRRMEQGGSVPMAFDVECRDGCFEDDQLFAVWETTDVLALIARLTQCLEVK